MASVSFNMTTIIMIMIGIMFITTINALPASEPMRCKGPASPTACSTVRTRPAGRMVEIVLGCRYLTRVRIGDSAIHVFAAPIDAE